MSQEIDNVPIFYNKFFQILQTQIEIYGLKVFMYLFIYLFTLHSPKQKEHKHITLHTYKCMKFIHTFCTHEKKKREEEFPIICVKGRFRQFKWMTQGVC